MADVWVRQTEGKRDTEESFDRARVAAEAVARWRPGPRPKDWAEDLSTMP